MLHGLATIAKLVRWMHEQCATTQTRPVREKLEVMISSWEQNGATLHELSALCDGYETVDVDVIELGRDDLGTTVDFGAKRRNTSSPFLARAS